MSTATTGGVNSRATQEQLKRCELKRCEPKRCELKRCEHAAHTPACAMMDPQSMDKGHGIGAAGLINRQGAHISMHHDGVHMKRIKVNGNHRHD
jgi:hypothetical protein